MPAGRQKRKREDGILEEPNYPNELPDLNDDVLGCIFNMCPLSDLRQIRLVSKQWYSVSLTRWRKEMTVVICPPTFVRRRRAGENDFDDDDDEDEEGTGFEWAELKKKLDVGDKPFRSYRLSLMDFEDPSLEDDVVAIPSKDNSLRMLNRHLPLFFRKFGSWIHKLELCHSEVPSEKMLEIFEATPNLEQLTLNGINQKSASGQDEETPDILELLGSVINYMEASLDQMRALQAHIHAFDGHVNTYEAHMNAFKYDVGNDGAEQGEEDGVLRVQPNSSLKRLVLKETALTLPFPFNWDFFFRRFPNIQQVDVALDDALASSPEKLILPLIEISKQLFKHANVKFIISPMVLRPRMPSNALAADTLLDVNYRGVILEKIIISRSYYAEYRGDELRQLITSAFRYHGHTLKELELHVPRRRNNVGFFGRFPFCPGPFTSLTTLELSGEFDKSLHFLKEFPNLTTVKISDCGVITARPRWERIGDDQFENISVFHFSAKSHIPERLLEMWGDLMPNVEDFVGVLSDSGLRIVCVKWRKLKRLFVGSREFVLEERRIIDEVITGKVGGRDNPSPNITYLQDLESLSIPKPEKMSDTCIWNGFLKLPRLRHLSVQLSEEASDLAFQALIKKFPGSTITRCDDDDTSEL